ncbi:hypothetical protein D039_4403A, partial [Vibrio parahaemolyticus EKP-028]
MSIDITKAFTSHKR